jgi:hypothetical protein
MTPPGPAAWILVWLIVPAWIGAGLLDWQCHRAARIERTSGARESILHLVMFAEIGVPLVACLLLRINAAVFALVILGFVAHEITSLMDVSYATRHREVTPFEQHVHSFLELLPLTAILLLAVLHPGQILALAGLGAEAADFALAWKQPPLPTFYIAGVLTAAAICGLLPYAEELSRGFRSRAVPRGSGIQNVSEPGPEP